MNKRFIKVFGIASAIILLAAPKLTFVDALEKAYSKSNLSDLFNIVDEKLNPVEVDTEFGLYATVSPNYQVYTSLTTGQAKVVYDVEYNRKNYRVYAETQGNYVEGTDTINDQRDEDILNKNYTYYDPFADNDFNYDEALENEDLPDYDFEGRGEGAGEDF